MEAQAEHVRRDLKVLHGKTDDDARALILRLQPGTVIGRHRHGGEVHAFHLAGQRRLLETGDILARGGYVYEPAGNVDSWMAVGDEALLIFMTVRGVIEDLDDEGHVKSKTTTSSIAERYRLYVDNHGGAR